VEKVELERVLPVTEESDRLPVLLPTEGEPEAELLVVPPPEMPDEGELVAEFA